MTSMFQEHPDGRIFVRRDDQEDYNDTIRNFQLDSGSVLEALPPNIDERIYVPGQFHALNSNENTVMGGPMPWEFGDNAIRNLPDLLRRQAERVEAEKPPPLPPPPITIISHRQLYQAAALEGIITREEALEAVRHGTIPAKIQAVVDTLPSDDKFTMEMFLSGAGQFDRNHPAVDQVGHLLGLNDDQMDELWKLGASL